MSTVEKPYWDNGEVPTAGDLNGPYTALSIASNAVQDDNTAPGWITEAHIAGAETCNKLYAYQNNTENKVQYNSAGFTHINDGVDNATVVLGFDADENEVLTFSAGGFIRGLEVSDTFDPVPPTLRGGTAVVGTGLLGRFNYFIFRLLGIYDDGAGEQALELGRWGYSYNTCAYTSSMNQHPNPPLTPELQNQTFQFTCSHRNEVQGRTFVRAELYIQNYHTLNAVTITRHHIICHRARR